MAHDPRRLQTILAKAAPPDLAVTFRPMFGGIMAYADGKPFASLSDVGLGLKCAGSGRDALLALPGAALRRYAPDQPPGRSYGPVPEAMLSEPDRLGSWVVRCVSALSAGQVRNRAYTDGGLLRPVRRAPSSTIGVQRLRLWRVQKGGALCLADKGQCKQPLVSEDNQVARINFVELPARDLDTASTFHGAVFGWELTGFGPDYACTMTGEVDLGLQGDMDEAPAMPLPVVLVDDLEAAQAAVERAGGVVSKPVFGFPGDRRSHFRDPNRLELAIMQAD